MIWNFFYAVNWWCMRLQQSSQIISILPFYRCPFMYILNFLYINFYVYIYRERATKIFNISCCFNKGTYLIKMTSLLCFFNLILYLEKTIPVHNFHSTKACIAKKQFQYTLFIMLAQLPILFFSAGYPKAF